MSKPEDFAGEVLREWLIRISHYDESRISFFSYGLVLRNRHSVRRCVEIRKLDGWRADLRIPAYTDNFKGKPSQYIIKYLNNRFKFKDLKIELIYSLDL